MTTITRRLGSEGPHHDPYSYSELTVARPNGNEVAIHEGLACWLEMNGRRVEYYGQGEEREARTDFERLAGVTPEVAARAYEAKADRQVRFHKNRDGVIRGGRTFREEAGYPGEYFAVCDRCGQFVAIEMHWSEIE